MVSITTTKIDIPLDELRSLSREQIAKLVEATGAPSEQAPPQPAPVAPEACLEKTPSIWDEAEMKPKPTPTPTPSLVLQAVRCEECGENFQTLLTGHLWKVHGMRPKEYRLKHPEAPLNTPEERKRRQRQRRERRKSTHKSKEPSVCDEDHVRCLLCKRVFESLYRHMHIVHGITIKRYREIHGRDVPVVGKASKARYEAAAERTREKRIANLIPKRQTEQTTLNVPVDSRRVYPETDGVHRVTCAICGETREMLGHHVKSAHRMALERYRVEHPGRLLIAKRLSEKISARMVVCRREKFWRGGRCGNNINLDHETLMETAKKFCADYCMRLKLTDNVALGLLVGSSDRLKSMTGRDPKSIAAAVVYVASLSSNPRPMRDIAEVANVSENSVSYVVNKIWPRPRSYNRANPDQAAEVDEAVRRGESPPK